MVPDAEPPSASNGFAGPLSTFEDPSRQLSYHALTWSWASSGTLLMSLGFSDGLLAAALSRDGTQGTWSYDDYHRPNGAQLLKGGQQIASTTLTYEPRRGGIQEATFTDMANTTVEAFHYNSGEYVPRDSVVTLSGQPLSTVTYHWVQGASPPTGPASDFAQIAGTDETLYEDGFGRRIPETRTITYTPTADGVSGEDESGESFSVTTNAIGQLIGASSNRHWSHSDMTLTWVNGLPAHEVDDTTIAGGGQIHTDESMSISIEQQTASGFATIGGAQVASFSSLSRWNGGDSTHDEGSVSVLNYVSNESDDCVALSCSFSGSSMEGQIESHLTDGGVNIQTHSVTESFTVDGQSGSVSNIYP